MFLQEYRLSDKIFVDANIFLFHALDIKDYSDDCTIFLKRIEAGEISAIITPLVIDEVLFKILVATASTLINKPSLWDIKKKMKEQEFSRSVYSSVRKYQDYLVELKKSGLSIIELDWKIVEESVALGEKYGLLISDAFHVATLKHNGIFHIATNDSDFDNIDLFTVWKPMKQNK